MRLVSKMTDTGPTIPTAEALQEQHTRDWQRIRDLIIHIFQQYPQISPSMLQISLALRAEDWHPVLEEMIGEHLIARWHSVRETPVTRRRQTYTTLLWVASDVLCGVQPTEEADRFRTNP